MRRWLFEEVEIDRRILNAERRHIHAVSQECRLSQRWEFRWSSWRQAFRTAWLERRPSAEFERLAATWFERPEGLRIMQR